MKDPSKLRESWHAVYGGAMNTGRIAVLEEGVKYQQIAIPPEEAQFLETRKFQIDEIARLHRVPPHMIGDLEKSSFNNIEQQSLEFVKYTLSPWVVRWEQSLQKALLTDKEREEYFIRFKVDGLLRGDYKSRMEGYAIGRQNGWLSANDIRSLEDLNPQRRRCAQAAGAYCYGADFPYPAAADIRRTSFFPSATRSSVLPKECGISWQRLDACKHPQLKDNNGAYLW